LIVFLLSAVPVFASSAEEVRIATTRWAEAVVNRDTAALESLLADDLEFVHPGGVSIQTKPEYIAAITDGTLHYASFTPRDLVVRIFDNTAAVSGFVDARLREGDSGTDRVTQLYVKSGGVWQLASSLATQLRDGDAPAQRQVGDPAGAVRDTAVAWAQAVARKDRAALKNLLSNDLCFALPDTSTLTKTAYIASVTGGATRSEPLALTSDLTIHVYGREAVLSGRLETPGSASAVTRFLQLYVKNGDKWQLTSSAATAVSSPNPNARRNANEASDSAAIAVRAAARAWTQAVVSRDQTALQTLLADDLIFGHSSGRPPQTKQEFLGSGENNDYEALPLRDIRVRVYGKTAVLSSYLDTKHRGRATNPVRTLQVFAENNDAWQLAVFQSARINPPQGERKNGGLVRPADAVRAVQDAAEGWTRAMVNRDKGALAPLLADDLVFVHSNGSTIQNQAQYLAASERATYEALPLSNVNTRIYGRTAALTAFIETKNIGREPFMVGTLQIFVEEKGQWQLAAFQSTRVKE
jgi:ketosteroid isomerase-like protein